jgi:hypothetical protein
LCGFRRYKRGYALCKKHNLYISLSTAFISDKEVQLMFSATYCTSIYFKKNRNELEEVITKLARFEGLRALVMKSRVFWDVNAV